MESITRSPIYSHFGETLSGAPTIRAYGMLDVFIRENEKRVDFNQVGGKAFKKHVFTCPNKKHELI
jgi:hypothetical protein